MAVNQIAMGINLRKNTNMKSTACCCHWQLRWNDNDIKVKR